MKKRLCSFAVFLSFVVSLHLCASDELQSKVELGQGYRRDSLKWSISGSHHKPKIISELDYKNLQVYLTTLKASLSNGTYVGVVDLAYGDIIRGKSRDSDYRFNNKRGEFSRSISRVSGDYTIDASAKIGRILPVFSGVTFTPSLGYGAFWQHLRVKGGRQIIAKGFWPGSLRYCSDTYKACWSAPFVDARFSAPLSRAVTLDLGYTFFYPLNYTGKGNWKLRHLHFTQKNRAWKNYGQKGDVSLRWRCTDKVELGLGIGLARFTAKEGKDSFKEHGFRGHIPFHQAQRTCVDYLLSLSYAF